MTRFSFSSFLFPTSMTTVSLLLLLLLFATKEVPVVNGMNSLNLNLEILDKIDVSKLGTPSLRRYNGTFSLTTMYVEEGVDEETGNKTYSIEEEEKNTTTCRYTLRIDLNNMNEVLDVDTPGTSNFEEECAPSKNTTGTQENGTPWHTQRKDWIKFPQYVYDTTGFDHLSVNWVPCGTEPVGFKKARYDLNFYTVLPQYRTFMVCDVFKTPEVCQYDQTDHRGRSMFTLPRLVNDPNFLANMPLHFQPDEEFPEAFQREGLIHYNKDNIPNTTEEWVLPTYLMSTYDASVVSWRAMIPHNFIYAKATARSHQNMFYIFQTMTGLPTSWHMSIDGSTGVMSVYVIGKPVHGLCGEDFEKLKEEEDDITTIIIGEEPSMTTEQQQQQQNSSPDSNGENGNGDENIIG